VARLGRPGMSDAQKRQLWDRWKAGESISQIARALVNSIGRCNTSTVREWCCGETEVASGRSSVAAPDALARAAPGQPAGDPAAVLAQDRCGAVQRGRRRRVRRVHAGGNTMVPRSWRHATYPPGPAVGALPVVCRPRGDRPAAGAAARGVRDRSPTGPIALHDLPRAPPQRRHPWRPSGLPGLDRTVACRPARPAPQDRQARRERPAAAVRAGPARRHRQRPRRQPGAGPGGALDRSPSRPAQGPTLGHFLEPAADRQPAAGRLPR